MTVHDFNTGTQRDNVTKEELHSRIKVAKGYMRRLTKGDPEVTYAMVKEAFHRVRRAAHVDPSLAETIRFGDMDRERQDEEIERLRRRIGGQLREVDGTEE